MLRYRALVMLCVSILPIGSSCPGGLAASGTVSSVARNRSNVAWLTIFFSWNQPCVSMESHPRRVMSGEHPDVEFWQCPIFGPPPLCPHDNPGRDYCGWLFGAAPGVFTIGVLYPGVCPARCRPTAQINRTLSPIDAEACRAAEKRSPNARLYSLVWLCRLVGKKEQARRYLPWIRFETLFKFPTGTFDAAS